MKLYKRLLSLLLVCLLCFGLFSVNAYASDVNILTNDINFRFFALDEHGSVTKKEFGHTTYVKSSDLPINFDHPLANLFNKFPDGNFNHYDIFDFAYIDSDKLSESQLYYGDKIILNKGENFKVSVSVVGSYFIIKNSNGVILNQFPLYQEDSFKIYFDLYDGSGNFVSVPVEDFEINLKTYTNNYPGDCAYYNISASYSNVPFDVYGVRLITVSKSLESFGGNLGTDFNAYKTYVLNGTWNIFRKVNVDSFSFVVDNSNKNLLNSIVSWLSNIKDNLNSGLSNVSNGLTNLGNRINSFFTNLGNTMTTNFNSMITNITSLGDRISGFFTNLSNNIKGFFTSLGDRISGFFTNLSNNIKGFFTSLGDRISGFFINLFENIRGLFIPSQGYFDSLSNRFDLLIEERFGALVTITDYLVEFFSSFNADNTKEFFDVPIININLMGYNFPIGGWQVRFVPQFNGVEILTNACKFISSVLATFAFFDGLKNKYHEVFGGGE